MTNLNPASLGPSKDDLEIAEFERQLRSARLPRQMPRLIAGAGVVTWLVLWVGLGENVALSFFLGWLLFVVSLSVLSGLIEGSRKFKDRLATTLASSAFVVALLPLVGLLWQVVSRGAPQVSSSFLSESMRNIIGQGGGIYHAIWGTILVTAVAALLSVPVGMLSAVYLVEYGRGRLATGIRFLVDVMTGIPSIVAGLFAYALFALFFGAGVRMGLGGSVALAVLMTPLVIRSTEEMLKLVPHDLREASYALGVPKWRTISKVVLPTALAGIVTGITIAVARVIGETAPLLIICGTTDSTNFNMFNSRIMTLPVFIYGQFKSPSVPPQFSFDRAWGAAFVLTIIVMVLSLVARLISYFFSPKKA
jgi:phosphate transport system permease protein